MSTTVRSRSTQTTPETSDTAGTLLFGRTRRNVLGWLYGHPDEAFYLREIVRRVDSAQGAVQRELELLTQAGLLTRTVRGNQVYFQANAASPIYEEVRRILVKTAGLGDVLRESLRPLGERVALAVVFGSAARGTLKSESDIDLLVVGDVTFSEVVAAVAGTRERLGREVNPTVYPPAEFEEKVRAGHHFLTRVLSEPLVFLIGGDDELGRLGAKRLADGAPAKSGGDSRPPRHRRTGSGG